MKRRVLALFLATVTAVSQVAGGTSVAMAADLIVEEPMEIPEEIVDGSALGVVDQLIQGLSCRIGAGIFIADLEPQRSDHMQMRTRCGTRTGNISRVLRDLGTVKNYIYLCHFTHPFCVFESCTRKLYIKNALNSIFLENIIEIYLIVYKIV